MRTNACATGMRREEPKSRIRVDIVQMWLSLTSFCAAHYYCLDIDLALVHPLIIGEPACGRPGKAVC